MNEQETRGGSNMKINRSQIHLLYEILSNFQKDESLPILTKYKTIKLLQVLEQEYLYNTELLKQFAEKYGEITENGEIFIKKEFLEVAQKELEDYNASEVELPDYQFTIEELSTTKINWRDMEVLIPLIKEI